MITDFRTLVDQTIIEADLCIVGAGAAGISIAKQFIGKKVQVCLLESGGLQLNDATQSLYQGKIVGLNYFPLEATRLRFFGGSTNHWGGWCAPLSDLDLQKREWVPYSGWPITKPDLDPYYIQAQQLCDVGPYRYHFADWQKDDFQLLELLPEKVINLLWQFSPRQIKFGQAYRAELEAATNIQVLLYANVTEIISNDTAQVIEGVKITSLESPQKTGTVRAKITVLACGGLENPRILLTSNRVQTNGLGNEYDNVGRFFIEHPHVGTGKLLTLTASRELAYYIGPTVRQGTHLQPALGVSQLAQQHHQILNVSVLMHAEDTPANAKAYHSFTKISRSLKAQRFSQLFQEDIMNVLTDLDTVATGLYYRLKGKRQPLSHDTAMIFRSMSEQMPNPDSRVLLDTEKDALGIPRIKLDWRLTDLDKQSIRVAHQLIGEELGRLGIGRLKIAEWLLTKDNQFEGLVGGHHHMGTTRMSDNPKQGVVDKNCRVHGIANLYIAGSSVFTTSGCSNPTLTLVALAVRLAEHLEKQVVLM
jgi:choline dehydrogenase-like flavoprotein